MYKFYQKCFIVFFMLILTLPMIKHLVSEDKIKSGENRNLTQKPVVPESFSKLGAFIKQTDDYLADQFGFRRNFIAASNRIKYYIFHEFNSKQITIGSNNFIYFNSHTAQKPNSLIKSVCNVSLFAKSLQQQFLSNIEAYINLTKTHGIKTNIAIIPTKAKIYPENLPELEKSWCINTSQPWWNNNAKEEIQKGIYYPLNKMLNLKNTIQVYLPHHFHWHGKLPYILAEDMIQALWKLPIEFNAKSKEIRAQSDLRFYFKGVHLYDNSVSYDFSPLNIEKSEGHNCIQGIEKTYKNNICYAYKTSAYNTHTKLVVLSDSFGQFIAKYFIRGFSNVITIDLKNLSNAEQAGFHQWLFETVKPTHILLLMHDGGVWGRATKLKSLINDLIPKFRYRNAIDSENI